MRQNLYSNQVEIWPHFQPQIRAISGPISGLISGTNLCCSFFCARKSVGQEIYISVSESRNSGARFGPQNHSEFYAQILDLQPTNSSRGII